MKTYFRLLMVMAAICAFSANAFAVGPPPPPLLLLGTTGACNNAVPGGPCTRQSTLVQLDPNTGALIRTIGSIGFTVNGLAWDRTSGKLYASTAIGDTTFHGLITIDPRTGAGTPVNPNATNFGLAVDTSVTPARASPVHSITMDFVGSMVGWYDEFPPPAGVTDTFVRIDKRTGIATEFPDTGIDTSSNGLSFQSFGPLSVLWNIDSPRVSADGLAITQTAYVINPFDGKPLLARDLFPPTQAAIGDFNPQNLLYYGLDFVPFDPTHPTFMVVVDPIKGTVTTLGRTVDDLHAIAFKHD